MSENQHNELNFFSLLNESEQHVVRKSMTEKEYKDGDTIFEDGDDGNDVFIVQSGTIAITSSFSHNVEKSIFYVREGMMFGELALIDNGSRSASAKAETNTKLLCISRDSFDRFLQEHPLLGQTFLKYFSSILSQRLRAMTSKYRQSTEWGLKVSGASSLNFSKLIEESAKIEVELTCGKSVKGHLLKIDDSREGREFFIEEEKKGCRIIPYHAITSISFDKTYIEPNSEIF